MPKHFQSSIDKGMVIIIDSRILAGAELNDTDAIYLQLLLSSRSGASRNLQEEVESFIESMCNENIP